MLKGQLRFLILIAVALMMLQCGKKGPPHPIQKPKQTTSAAGLSPVSAAETHEA